jgi:hypothetical protein
MFLEPLRAIDERSVGSCFNETLLSTCLTYVTAVGIGLVVGAVIGFSSVPSSRDLPDEDNT